MTNYYSFRGVLVAGFLGLTIIPATRAADKPYEFPQGFPYRVAEVEWYTAAQEFHAGAGIGMATVSYFPQTWNFRQFPWKTGGLDDSDNAVTYKFRIKSRRGPIYHEMERSRYFSNETHRVFQLTPGEIFGELIQTDGRDTEIGLLEVTSGDPKFTVYRPFGPLSELKPYVTHEQWSYGTLRNSHSKAIVDEQGIVVSLNLSPEGVNTVLARPFKNVTDQVFAEAQDGAKTFAPTTEQRHGVVPRFSKRGFFTTKTCMNCHATAGVEGRLLDPNPRDARFGNDLYGDIRGGSKVFSAPFKAWIRRGETSSP